MENPSTKKSISSLVGMFDKKPSTSLSNNNLSTVPPSNPQNSSITHSNTTTFPPKPSQPIAMRARNMEQKNKPSTPLQKHNTVSFTNPNSSLSFLDDSSPTAYTYLTPVSVPHTIFNPTFCEAFIMVSFPLSNGEPIPPSSAFPPPCNHFLCSKLPSMKPDILFSYPESPPSIDINALVASMCFPQGIKVCHGNPLNPQETPPQLQDIITCISNQSADRFYLVSSSFYFKILIDKFNSELYKTHPASIYKEELFKEVALNGSTLTEKQAKELEHVNSLF